MPMEANVNRLRKSSLWRPALALAALCLAAAVMKAHAQETLDEGPRGGTLLRGDGFELEITIFERGVPPEMRVYAYRDGRALRPEAVSLTVMLERLGGRTDTLRFRPEQDYLLAQSAIAEPHSFDVRVSAAYAGKSANWRYASHEGRTQISPRMQAAAKLGLARVGPVTLAFKRTLFGVIAPIPDRVQLIEAPYPSLVEALHVGIGDPVARGQPLITLRNTRTLEAYPVASPAAGEVIALAARAGMRAEDQALLEVADLSSVWVQLSAFPEDVETLRPGQSATIYDLHRHKVAHTRLSYIAPVMTGGHIARARAVIPNPDGHWRPGMHLKADVHTGRRSAPMAVHRDALQEFRGMPVVFARYGDIFEVRMLELGQRDDEFVEVLGGIEPGTEYVSRNSFVVKADVLKDGASHDH